MASRLKFVANAEFELSMEKFAYLKYPRGARLPAIAITRRRFPAKPSWVPPVAIEIV